uniref:Uncharacterized protein n=1 Tax=Avena sativa TaxID=4498 RepID=A0ACD5WM88_AVESA
MSNVFDHGGHGGGGEQGQQQGDTHTLLCYFHPRELLVGVCAHCLRERLLLLLASNSKQQEGQGGGRARVPADGASYLSARPYCRAIRRVRTGSIVSVLALGSSFIHRLDSSSSRHHHSAHDGGSHDGNVDCKVNPGGDDAAGVEDDDASIASLDDSFISIKFEDNGKATWANAQSLQTKPDHAVDGRIAEKASSATTTTVVVEHVRRGGATRWRKQVVGRLLQLARWKRASSSSGGKAQPAACHVQRAEQQRSSKGRSGRGWIRSLTRRRAAHGERAWS